MDESLLITVGLVGVAGLCVAVGIFAIPAMQAKRRGYSFFVWLLAGMLVVNPIYLLVVLGVSPHRKRQRLREQFRRELDAKLSAAIPTTPAGPIPERSLGDQPTLAPGSAGATDAPGRSVGDAATVLPPARSLGDELTRP
jgi:heme exporter protein D